MKAPLRLLCLPLQPACPSKHVSADLQANPCTGAADTDNQQWWFCGTSPQMAGNGCVVSRGSSLSFGLEQALEGDFVIKKTFNLMNAANQI